MLFRKRIPKACAYCIHGTKLDGEQVLCPKRQFVSADSHCYRFKYDPCKRIPPKPKAVDFNKFNSEDFSL